MAGLVGWALVAAAILMGVQPLLDLPGRVDEVTIENPHAWNVNVEVTDGARRGWLGVGSLDRGTSQVFEELLDQGDQWVFRFHYAGQDGGGLALTRAELEQAGWKLTVPEGFAARMQEAGLPPSG